MNAEQTWTNGYVVPTTQSVLAMHAAGFIEYLPFKSRMSPFYDNRWKAWPIKEKGSGLGIFGVGQTTLDLIHYQTQPLGQNTILPTAGTHASTEADATAPVKAMWSDGKTLTNFSVVGINADGLNKAYKATVWNMPGVDAATHTESQADLLLSASNLRAFTIYPREAPASGEAHYDYSNSVTGSGERAGKTAWESAGAIVNRLYSWAGVQNLPTNGTFAAGAKFNSAVYMNVISRMMQKEALAHAQCAGFICIIVVQWADLMICKTRWLSIRQQGMVNPIMNFGLLFETILGCFLCYVPGLGDVLGTRPIRFQHWFPGMPFCLFIFFYDEMRKYLMRTTSKKIRDKDTKKMNNIPGWLEINTYY